MRRAECTIDFVVSRHKCPGVAVANGDLEWLKMDFAKSPFGNFLVDEETSCLLVVCDEVFYAGPDAGVLDGVDEGCGQLSREERVFAVGFEVAPAERCPGNAYFERCYKARI